MKAWDDDRCSEVAGLYVTYKIPVVAALWCGVPEEDVDDVLAEASPVSETSEKGKALLVHPRIKCFGPRVRVMQEAIDSGELQACDETGSRRTGVAYSRRHVYMSDLKEWSSRFSENERPQFLFGVAKPTKNMELTTRERQTHQVIIAALCKKAGIDWEARGAATKISHALDGIGISVDDDTIRKILKELPESIEARTR